MALVGDDSEHVAMVRMQEPLIEEGGGIKYGRVNISLYVCYNF